MNEIVEQLKEIDSSLIMIMCVLMIQCTVLAFKR